MVLTLLDLEGNALTATGDLSGNLVGTHMWGKFDYQTGLGRRCLTTLCWTAA